VIHLDEFSQPVHPLEKYRLQSHFFDDVKNRLNHFENASGSANERPIIYPLTPAKRQKSDEVGSGGYGGCGAIFIRLSSKHSTYSLAVCGRASFARIMNLRSFSGASDARYTDNGKSISVL
jgi:hypothetical protein